MAFLVKTNAIWRVPLILLWTAVMACLSMAVSLFDQTGRCQHWCARTWSRFIIWVSRVRIDIQGLENLDRNKAYILVSNHLSIFDHWAFLSELPFQFRFAAKASLFRIPFLGWHLQRSGNIAVDPQNHRQTLRSFQQAARRIKQGISFVIYPEGMRTFGDTVAPFKRGSLLLARYANAPIVPVTIIGAHRRLARGSIYISPGSMQMIIHTPVEFENYLDLDLDVLADAIRSTISNSYQQIS